VLAAALGPALIAYNDATFTDENFESVQRIADSDKPEDLTKTGRYGLGFNVCYNVTDTPLLLSRDRVCVFDPHETISTQMGVPGSAGLQLSLSEVWDQFPELGQAFAAIGLADGQTTFEGTAFRFPIRTERLASQSKISQETVQASDIDEILVETGHLGAELLLFLRSVSLVEIGYVKDGEVKITSSAKITNKSEVGAKRGVLNEMIRTSSWQAHLKDSHDHCMELLYEQTVGLQVDADCWSESWLVVSGLYGGEEEELLHHAEEAPQNEKPIPLAGAALRLCSTGQSEPLNGVVYCMLPLPGNSGLPVHLNGFIALDPSRQATSYNGSGLVGKDARRARWNSLLAEHGIARAYATLISAHTRYLEDSDYSHSVYGSWPQEGHGSSHLPEGFYASVYWWLQGLEVVRVPGDGTWRLPKDVHVLPTGWTSLQEPLVAQEATIPEPRLPSRIVINFKESGFEFKELNPSDVRRLLSDGPTQDCLPKGSDFPCLRKPEWIASIFKFCLFDGQHKECMGLPLALHLDGKLRNFGNAGFGVKRLIFISETDVHVLLGGHLEWFLEPQFAESAGLTTKGDFTELGLRPLGCDLMPKVLEVYLEDFPEPTDEWIASAILMLLKFYPESPSSGWLSDLRLVPDQAGQRHAFGSALTPLIPTDSEHLVPTLTKIGVPTVGGNTAIKDSLVGLNKRNDFFVWAITPRDLIDSLVEAKEVLHLLTVADCEMLVDFILHGFEELPDDRKQALRKLPIFPVSGAQLRPLPDSGGLLMPNDLEEISGVARDLLDGEDLFQPGPEGKWRPALKLIGLKEAKPETIVGKLLLPRYADLTKDIQLKALTYIFKNLDTIWDSGDEALITVICQTPLVHTAQHGLTSFEGLYAHDGKYYELLPKGAPVPNLDIYKGKHWEKRFKDVGIADKPRPWDIIEAIKQSRPAKRTSRSDKLLSKIFEYINSEWDFLKKHGGEKFVATIKDGKWVPNITQPSELLRFGCSREFEADYYRPSQLASKHLARYLAATMPIAPFSNVNGEVAKALNTVSWPSPQQLCSQLSAVCDALSGSGEYVLDRQQLKKCTDTLYQAIGQRLRQDQSLGDVVRKQFSHRACVWDDQSKKMWLPSESFKQSIPLAGLRLVCASTDNDIERFFDCVGRRHEPDGRDLVEILIELKHDHEGQTLSSEFQGVTCNIWKKLIALEAEADDAPLLDRTGRLQDSVYDDDLSESYVGLDLSPVPLVHPDIRDVLYRMQRTLPLSKVINEHLAEVPSPFSQATGECKQLERWVRSADFARGLYRLLKPSNRSIRLDDLQFLQDLSIQVVKTLRTEVWLENGGEPVCLGTRSPVQFISAENIRLYVLESSLEDLDSHIGDALEVLLLARLMEVESKHFAKMISMGLRPNPSLALTNFLDSKDVPKIGLERSADEEESVDSQVLVSEPLVENGEEDSSDEPWDKMRHFGNDEADPDIQAGALGREETFERNVGASSGDSRNENPEPTFHQTTTQSVTEPINAKTADRTEHSMESSQRDTPGITSPPRPPNMQSGGLHPPTTPGHGRSSTSSGQSAGGSTSSRSSRLRTYVHQNPLSDYDTGESDGEDVALGREGERLVIEWERQQGRIATSMNEDRENHEGYDIESEGSQEKRCIEVKSVRHNWTQLGVGVTKAQKEAAERFGRSWWLYVVEYAGDSSKAIIHEIPNPFMQASEYRFDDGWRHLADGSGENTGAKEPVVGETYERGDGSPVTVKSGKKMGDLWRVEIECSDGQTMNVAWSPTWRKV
jgi:sacsin